jgi:hypothetical protein
MSLSERQYARRSWGLLSALRTALRTDQNVHFASSRRRTAPPKTWHGRTSSDQHFNSSRRRDGARVASYNLSMAKRGRGTGHPHEHGDGPSALIDQLDAEGRRAVICDNAPTLYGIPE